jgi:hypothetical protein
MYVCVCVRARACASVILTAKCKRSFCHDGNHTQGTTLRDHTQEDAALFNQTTLFDLLTFFVQLEPSNNTHRIRGI